MRPWLALVGLSVVALALAASLPGLPGYVAGFERWEKVVVKGLPDGGPHPGKGKVVVANPLGAKAWKGTGPLPVGSIVVKTTGPLAKPELVAVMRKDRSGWFYEEYLPGSGGSYRLAFGGPGRQGLCVGCHEDAKAKDYLFTRP